MKAARVFPLFSYRLADEALCSSTTVLMPTFLLTPHQITGCSTSCPKHLELQITGVIF